MTSSPGYRRCGGFTAFELLVVVIIIAVVYLFAAREFYPALDRARVAEAFTGFVALRTMAQEHHAVTGRWPEGLADLGVEPDPAEPERIGPWFTGRFFGAPRIEGGAIVLTGLDAGGQGFNLTDRTLAFRPVVADAGPPVTVHWACGYARPRPGFRAVGAPATDLSPLYLPHPCRVIPTREAR